ncbi:hypothetical protein [Haladaptatus sp.]|uniref:hypothetical protein n=1 Tax=Haladaptatus sp. TaxID=1973141 RepID=UPI003C4590C6
MFSSSFLARMDGLYETNQPQWRAGQQDRGYSSRGPAGYRARDDDRGATRRVEESVGEACGCRGAVVWVG